MAEKNEMNLYVGIVSIYLLLRPLSLLFYGSLNIEGLKFQDFFAITTSYIFVIIVFVKIKEIRFDLITIFIFFFIIYSFMSLLWGSSLRALARLILPFFVFFTIRILTQNKNQICIYLKYLIIGYILPIMINLWFILSGHGITDPSYRSGLSRATGVFQGPHTLAHSMSFFIYTSFLTLIGCPNKRKIYKYAVIFLSLTALFCTYRSFTRTALAGLIIFFSIYIFKTSKTYFILFLFLLTLIFLFNIHTFQKIVLNVRNYNDKSIDLDNASSGRLSIWKYNLRALKNAPFEIKLIGFGLGTEVELINAGKKINLIDAHNDYLEILISFGIIGFSLYLSINICIIYDLYRSNINRKYKRFFISFFVAIIFMNFLSNSYITRFELSQLFWFMLGLFYSLNKMESGQTDISNTANSPSNRL